MEGSKQHDFGGRGSSRVVIVVILAIVVVAAVIFIFRSSAENDELTFAAIFPLTGNVSYHKALAEAMQLAVEEVNESGGIQGRRIRLVIADNASKPANAVKEFHRLLKEEHPDVMFCSLSSVSAVLAPLAEENRIPLIALVTSSPNSVKGRKWVYKFYNNPGSGIPILLDVLHEQGVHVLGIINQDDAFGVSYANSLVKIFEKDGGKTVRLQYPTGHIDALPDLSPLMDTDAICIAALPGRCRLCTRQSERQATKINCWRASPEPCPQPGATRMRRACLFLLLFITMSALLPGEALWKNFRTGTIRSLIITLQLLMISYI